MTADGSVLCHKFWYHNPRFRSAFDMSDEKVDISWYLVWLVCLLTVISRNGWERMQDRKYRRDKR